MAHEIPDAPFQILVIGDFSGRANRDLHAPLAGRHPFRIDCDNLDDTIANMGVALHLPQAKLVFRELDDFHPDRIYRNAELFRKLEATRDLPPVTRPPLREASQPGRSLLDQMMDEGEAPAPASPGDPLIDFIEKAVAPHLEKSDPAKKKWSAQVDALAGASMRTMLHHPDFQSLEAAWRAVQMLVRHLNPDSELRIHLLDATLPELLDDPRQFAEGLAVSQEPWALLVANFAFGQSAEDAAHLLTLGRIAAGAGAPILAEAQPPDGASDPDWNQLRRSSEARWIGLALPRFLLRLPYGKATSEVDSFQFEEMPKRVHTQYLWGNPAFACACLLGDAFRDQGWSLSPGRGQITNLPQHFYEEGCETLAKPCAEILLTERDAELLLENGLMPVASLKNQDAILLPRIQSIADPPTRLAGRWDARR